MRPSVAVVGRKIGVCGGGGADAEGGTAGGARLGQTASSAVFIGTMGQILWAASCSPHRAARQA